MSAKRVVLSTALAVAVAAVALGLYALARPSDSVDATPQISVAEALGDGNGSGFSRALAPRPFEFPADHGPHTDFGLEWWYFTGNLDTSGDSAEPRHFGFQLTFFRIGLAPEAVQRESAWATSQMFMAHLALTDVEGGRFYSFERLGRDALGLAGAQAQPFRVWLEDWSAQGGEEATLPVSLKAAEGEVSIDLTLTAAKGPVLNGESGFSRKSAVPGNASYYYSMSRMPAGGTVRVGQESFDVTGAAWMDREWSTSALAEDQVGWDWFALQLSDGRELMYFQLRLEDGGIDPFSAGTFVLKDGSSRPLSADEVQIEVLDRWQSPLGGAPYPSRWRVRVPSESLVLEVVPYLEGQELDLSVRYWEGAVHLEGSADGRPVSGEGYVEMTGYAGSGGGRS